jgi:hypothetical protein
MTTLAACISSGLLLISAWLSPEISHIAFSENGANDDENKLSSSLAWQEQTMPNTGTILEFAVSPNYAQGGALYILAWDGVFKVWRYEAGAWQVILSSGGAVSSLEHLAVNQAGHLAVSGTSSGQPSLWVSKTDGVFIQSTPSFTIDLLKYAHDGTLVIAGYSGSAGTVCRSTDGGQTFGTVTSAGSVPLNSLTVSPAFAIDGRVALGTINGELLISADRGDTFSRIAGPAAGNVSVSFDASFNGSGSIYTASDAPGSGFYALAYPSLTWMRLDIPDAGSARLRSTHGGNGLGYAADYRPVDAGNGQGGLLRYLGDGGGTVLINSGLAPGATLWQLETSAGRVWALDSTHNRLFYFTDSAAAAPELIAPPDFALKVGVPVGGGKIGQVTLEWTSLTGAEGYLWQVSTDAAFTSIPAGNSGITAANTVMVWGLAPVTFYFWRVRVETPLAGPWSDVRLMQTSANELGQVMLIAPAAGSASVPIRPLFSWQAPAGATRCELQVCLASDFTSPVVSRQVTDIFWQATSDLASSATYFWRARASTPAPGPWSEIRSFTTQTNRPGVPRLESPSNGLSEVPCSPVFAWSALSGVTSYELALSTRADFAVILTQRSVGNTWWQSNIPLEQVTRYYWRVRAIKSGVAGEWSETFNFTTLSPGSQPTTSASVGPTTLSSTPPPSPPPFTSAPVSTPSSPVTTPISSGQTMTLPVLGSPPAVDNTWVYYALLGAGGMVALLGVMLVSLLKKRGR